MKPEGHITQSALPSLNLGVSGQSLCPQAIPIITHTLHVYISVCLEKVYAHRLLPPSHNFHVTYIVPSSPINTQFSIESSMKVTTAYMDAS